LLLETRKVAEEQVVQVVLVAQQVLVSNLDFLLLQVQIMEQEVEVLHLAQAAVGVFLLVVEQALQAILRHQVMRELAVIPLMQQQVMQEFVAQVALVVEEQKILAAVVTVLAALAVLVVMDTLL
jgi:hypothetical protein